MKDKSKPIIYKLSKTLNELFPNLLNYNTYTLKNKEYLNLLCGRDLKIIFLILKTFRNILLLGDNHAYFYNYFLSK